MIVLSAAAALAFGTTFVVDSTGDEPDADTTDGLCRTALATCTLRAAIQQANATPGADTIAFNIPGTGVHTISPASPLPPLTDDAGVTIDGYTQPGASPNTLPVGDDAVLLVALDGTNAGSSAAGLTIAASNGVVRGLLVQKFETGIRIQGGNGNTVTGCFIELNLVGILLESVLTTFNTRSVIGGPGADRNLISGNANSGISANSVSDCWIAGNYVGTDPTGMIKFANGDGIDIESSDAVVGGFASDNRNVISGNAQLGIRSADSTTAIRGNFIGTNSTGTAALPQAVGIRVDNDSGSSIGTPLGSAGNLISGNLSDGVQVFEKSANTRIDANLIGTDASGTSPLGNGGAGIYIFGAVVGGPTASAVGALSPNVIAFNTGAGIAVGVSTSDSTNDNFLYGNSIHDNGGLGIDLGSDGVTPNNSCDSGRGPNLGQNYPILVTATPSGPNTVITGTLNSVPDLFYQLQFYSNSLCDPSGHGEGETFLGSTFVATDDSCTVGFQVTLPVPVPLGSFITATATDPAGNTSEFSACRPVTTGTNLYTVTPCRVADTRGPAGPYGSPSLAAAANRSFTIAGQCGIPADAKAVAFNFTVTNPAAQGDVQVFPGGTPLPVPPTLFYSAGQTRAKNAILALGSAGDIGTYVDQPSGLVDFIIDVTGYFR
jgi:CSLREA domain-containing protein